MIENMKRLLAAYRNLATASAAMQATDPLSPNYPSCRRELELALSATRRAEAEHAPPGSLFYRGKLEG